MRILLRWIIGAVALFITVKAGEALHLQLAFQTKGGANTLVSAFIFILVLSLVNAFIRPIVNFFTAPLNCLTFGLFSFVVNALMFLLVGQIKEVGLTVNGFVPALFGSVVLSLVSGILNAFITEKDGK
jgi:putative membrane protein